MKAAAYHTVVVCRGVFLEHCMMASLIASVSSITRDVCPAQEVKVSA